MTADRNHGAELRLVAFGASAGGLQALRPIINGLKGDGVSAYLVAHHLSPSHPSSLVELLAAHSSLQVVVAAQGEPLRADHVYVCPPGYDIEVARAHIVLIAAETSKRAVPSIDRLFRSLAGECADQTVVVVLSGSGHDGALGAEAVNAVNGTVIVQQPEEAVQPGLPQAVIHTGYADLVGNSEQIIAWLGNLGALGEAVLPTGPEAATQAFEELFQQVAQATGLDIGQYKENTLRRQTVRRYRSLGMSSLEQYLSHVRSNPEELFPLQQSFMISVSSFFRDPEAFDALEKVLRKLAASKQVGGSIRVWVPACATGEEPYSIAILLAEILGERLARLNVRIFATDIDQAALDFARAAVYSTSALVQLSSTRRQRWFTPEGNGWRIDKTIRELCVFSLHDVIAHPPFIKMDLVSCRNLLIYFKPEQQADLISTFHYGLNTDGLLLLGKSEAAGFNSRLFETLDGSVKLYRRRTAAATHPARLTRLGMPSRVIRPVLPTVAVTPRRQTLVDATLSTIAREYGPPGVLVNASFEPLHFFGSSQRYFSLPGDHADFSVFSLCLPNLRSELMALCYRLVQENLDCLQGVGVDLVVDGEERRIRPVLRRIPQVSVDEEFAFLISFDELESSAAPLAHVPASAQDQRSEEVVRLRQELAQSREHLQAVIEELEASNEELQSLNEEVQSSSEELQSSNEELQSSNEELTTLNDELRVKSLEAVQLTTTLGNIQNSIRTSLVVVDRDGRITRYNSLATRVFGLVANDVGQFLYGVPCHLQVPHLRQQVSEVIQKGVSLVEKVRQGNFHYLMQIDPYRDELGKNAGAVLTFSDISDLHRAELAQQNSEVRFRRVWESSVEGLLLVDSRLRIVEGNPALESMFGYASGELNGVPVSWLVPEAERERHAQQSEAFLRGPAQSRSMGLVRDIRGLRRDGSTFPVEISLSHMAVDGERYVLASVSDITERRAAEEAQRQSEQRLRLAQDAAHAGTWEWHLQSNENFWSDEIWNLFGLDPQQVTPSFESWRNAVHPQDRERVVAAITEAAARASEFETDWQVNLPATEKPRYLLSRGRPDLGPDGKPTRYIGIVLDISERKRVESEMAQYRDSLEEQVHLRTTQLTELYNRAPCGYHSLDAEGRFMHVNDTELGWLGYTREEMVGGRMRAIDVMAPHCRDIFQVNFPKLMQTGELNGLEFEFVRKDGTLLPILLNAKAVFDEHGQLRHSLSTILDNTERKRAEAAWVAAREAAESANRAKSAFLANMSHEIRTPLNAIIGLGHLLRRSQVDPSQAEQLDKIDASAQHLLAVISDILDLSKIEADKFALDRLEFDLNDIVANVVSMLNTRVASKGLTLGVECDNFGYRVAGDPTRFTQALLNLASNAVKFTSTGAVTIRLRKMEEMEGRVLVRVEVTDTGCGVPPEVLPRLFSAFEQGDASTTRKAGGTGLGLAITRRLAGLMDGETGATSTVGRGSTFWFSAWLTRLAAGAAALPAVPAGAGQEEQLLVRDFRGTPVLLVEDDPINQEVGQMFLDDIGLKVTLASNGREALELARQRPFALVLMDMQMPEMDGLEATQQIRQLPGWAAIPIVAMTANAFAEDRAQCLDAGMNDFITKPFDPDKFFATLLHWLTRSRQAGPAA